MRISVKLDNERAEKLRELRGSTQLSVSEIVKRAIDLLHRQETERCREKIDDLMSNDFVGCAQGPEDLAGNYKRYLTQSLLRKHDPG